MGRGEREIVDAQRAKKWLSRATIVAADAALDLFFPRTCVCCDSALSEHDSALVCALCLSRIIRLPEPQCHRCGHPTAGRACLWCKLLPAYVRCARSLCWVPTGVGGDLVHKLKYDGWTALAEPMSRRMATLHFPLDVVRERSVVIPVPLAASRKRERGYNQSGLLAAGLASAWRIGTGEMLARTRATETQTRLTPGGRLRNVASAFETTVSRDELIGKHIILVDDVVTTAATLNACAAALHAGGARIITYVTFGRARSAGDSP